VLQHSRGMVTTNAIHKVYDENVTNTCAFKTTINKLKNWIDTATKNNQTGNNQELNVMTEVNEHHDITITNNNQVS
jgi:hypothetical protein